MLFSNKYPPFHALSTLIFHLKCLNSSVWCFVIIETLIKATYTKILRLVWLSMPPASCLFHSSLHSLCVGTLESLYYSVNSHWGLLHFSCMYSISSTVLCCIATEAFILSLNLIFAAVTLTDMDYFGLRTLFKISIRAHKTVYIFCADFFFVIADSENLLCNPVSTHINSR